MLKISRAQVLHAAAALIITPLAGVVTVWLGKHFPGLPAAVRNKESLEHEALIAMGGAFTFGLHYLKGLQWWERAEAEGTIKVEDEPEPNEALAALAAPTAPPAHDGGAPGGD